MVSAKGLLYTAVAATAAAVIVGTVLTPERRTKLINYAKNNSGPLLDKAKSLLGSLGSSQSAGTRAEFDQANRMGHA
jgi:hypothetical protein